MFFGHKFPYTNFHELNLDWIVGILKKAVLSVNGYTPDDTGNVELPTVPTVSSVNGKQGVVVLDAADVGAIPDSVTVPTKTSELQNDSGFITAAQAGAVTSVNGQVGDVVLTIPDPSNSSPANLGTAAAGVSSDYSRADHVHKIPTPGEIGAAPAAGSVPSDGNSGDILIKSASQSSYGEWKPPKEIIWQNPALGSFAAQTITGLDFSDFYFVIIEFSVAGSATALKSELGVVGTTGNVEYNTAYNNKLRQFSRDFTINATSIQFYDANATTEGANTAISNNLLVPYKIWGLRL